MASYGKQGRGQHVSPFRTSVHPIPSAEVLSVTCLPVSPLLYAKLGAKGRHSRDPVLYSG